VIFQHIVFAAPDIRKGTFLERVNAVETHSRHATLYASSRDMALFLSKLLNGEPRAGDSNPEKDIVVVDGVDTLDVSAISTNLTGHSYYGDNRAFLSDLAYLLNGVPAGQRFGIQRVPRPPREYYRFVP
jgi:esterase/lipase superfamily enzyme